MAQTMQASPSLKTPATSSACIQCRARDIRSRFACIARAEVQERAPAEAHPLGAWMEQRGVPSKKQRAQPELLDDGLALVATQPVPRGQAVAVFPSSAWLTQQAVQKSPIGAHVQSLEGWLQIALFLLHERASPGSAWRQYLDSLPGQPQMPLFWAEAELAELRGTQLLASVEGYRRFFEAKHAELEAAVFAPHRDAFPPDAFGLPAFLWAAATVRARAHPPLDGDAVALVPVADLVRHRRGAGVRWTAQAAGNVFAKGQALALEAGRDLQEGEILYMDYGSGGAEEKLDSQILLDYGAFDPDSNQGGFVLGLELPDGDRFYDDKADVLELNGLAEASSFLLRADREPPEQLLGFLRLLNLAGGDAFLLESLFRNEAWGHMLAPISEANERAVYLSMTEGCRAALQGYPTSINDDLLLLRDAPAGSRLQAAISMRLAEKETLDATLRFFEERFDRIGQLEFYQERRLKRLGLLDDDGRTTYDSFFTDGIA